MDRKYVIGVDIGGSHIRTIAVDIKLEEIVPNSWSSLKVNNHAPAQEILTIWAEAIALTLAKIGSEELLGVGIAIPGPFDYEKGIALFANENAKYENLNGVNVGIELKKILKLSDNSSIRFINDATAFAVGEAWIGKTASYKKSMAITLGTGFGSAFIESGLPILERNDVPKLGCVWHLPYKNGIADDYFSTRWFINRCNEVTGKSYDGVREISVEAPFNKTIKAVFEEFGTNLGEFLAPWICSFDAPSLVVGGNVVGAYNLWGPAFQAKLHTEDIQLEVVLSDLMETSAMVGAAKLLNDKFWVDIRPLLSKM